MDFIDLRDFVVTVVSSRPIDSSVNGNGPGKWHVDIDPSHLIKKFQESYIQTTL